MPARRRQESRREIDSLRPERSIVTHHLGGLAFMTPPSVMFFAYLALDPAVPPLLYGGGLLLSMGLAFALGIYLSDYIRAGGNPLADHQNHK